MDIMESALKKHKEWKGKIEIVSRTSVNNREELSNDIYFEQTYLGLILLLAVSLAPISAWLKEAKRRSKFRNSRRGE